MSLALTAALPSFATVRAAAKPPRQNQSVKTQKTGGGATKDATTKRVFSGKKKEPLWQCVKGCGACCMLDKGPDYASPEELFDDPSDVQLYRSMIGSDGWCKHYEKGTRTCSIYLDRPYFCRAEPDIWEKLYGVRKKNFNKEAIGSCRGTIEAIYGSQSDELKNYNCAIRNSTSKSLAAAAATMNLSIEMRTFPVVKTRSRRAMGMTELMENQSHDLFTKPVLLPTQTRRIFEALFV